VPERKTCGKAIAPQQATASIFVLGFLRLNGMLIARRPAKILAKRVGLLCREFLGRRKDLGIELP
jgi:hypothetical protein